MLYNIYSILRVQNIFYSYCNFLTLSFLSASFLRKYEQFFLKMHHAFLYDNFNKIFLLKLSYKNSCVKFDALSRRNGTLFFLKNEALRSESVNLQMLSNFDNN